MAYAGINFIKFGFEIELLQIIFVKTEELKLNKVNKKVFYKEDIEDLEGVKIKFTHESAYEDKGYGNCFILESQVGVFKDDILNPSLTQENFTNILDRIKELYQGVCEDNLGNLYSKMNIKNKKYYIKSSIADCQKDKHYEKYCNECVGVGKNPEGYESEFKCPVNFDDLKTSSHFTVSIDISYYVRLYFFDMNCLRNDVYSEIYKDSIDILKLYGDVDEKLIDSLHGFILYVIDYSSNMLRWGEDRKSYAKSYFTLKPRTKIINLFNSFSEDLQELIMSIKFPEDYNDSLFFKRIIENEMNTEYFFVVSDDIHEYDKKQNDKGQITVEFRNSFNYGTFLLFKEKFFINLQNMFKALARGRPAAPRGRPAAPRGRVPSSRSRSPAANSRDRSLDVRITRSRSRSPATVTVPAPVPAPGSFFKSKKSKTKSKSKTNSKKSKTNSKSKSKTKSKSKSNSKSKTNSKSKKSNSKSKKSNSKSKTNSKTKTNSKLKNLKLKNLKLTK